MKRIVLSIVCMLLLAVPALAQKIGYVDLQKALNMSTAGQKAKEEISGKFQGYQDELASRQEELRKLKEPYVIGTEVVRPVEEPVPRGPGLDDEMLLAQPAEMPSKTMPSQPSRRSSLSSMRRMPSVRQR